MRPLATYFLLLLAAMPFSIGAQDHSEHQAEPTQPSAAHEGHGERKPPQTATGNEHAQHKVDHSQHQSTETTAPHIPPDPPQHAMRDMSEEDMIELMEMNDNHAFGMLRADSFEWRDTDDGDVFSWDVQGWYGGDYTKLWVETEGEAHEGDVESRNELLIDRVVARWWSVQAGVRNDSGEGQSRNWVAFGVQGLAPYWFEVEATAYVAEEGHTALRLSAEYELLLTQRLILQPQIELDVYGKADEEVLIGSGLSDAEVALRLRYEVRREFAPYLGVSWERRFGDSADLVQAAGRDRSEVQWLAGVRWWF